MNAKQIIFPEINKAALVDTAVPALGPHDVMVRTAVSTVSAGTERANITGNPYVNGAGAPSVTFPRTAGYSSSGVVMEVGSEVKSVVPGDRVAMFWSVHKSINVMPEEKVVRIPDGSVSFETAALANIATFPLAAIRKTRLEIGESALVMGLGPLGMIAVKLLRAAGAVPIIAVDPKPARREIALKNGANFVFDPFEDGFSDKVKAVTDGGVKVAIEVTGVGAGLNGALDCMARFGRVALLGCTRSSDFTVDYYRKVHSPGITLIGAHTMARPDCESHPGWFTGRDDMSAVLRLCARGRLELENLVEETHSPTECETVYERLINDPDFPVVVQFNWREDNA